MRIVIAPYTSVTWDAKDVNDDVWVCLPGNVPI